MDSEPEIIFEERGSAGLVTLNRPKALNAVTHGMVRALAAKLTEWSTHGTISRVVVNAAGGRAFSAGGDIRVLYDLGQAGRQAEALEFWRDEYRLNVMIKSYPKPYIALIDGIVMGGGVGVSVLGSHRIAGDRFQFAMPEVGIGFFPDVGATFFLPRLPGKLGTYCALTGARLATGEGMGTGVATHYVPSDRHAALREALCAPDPLDAVLKDHAVPPPPAAEAARWGAINRLFGGNSVAAILQALDDEAAGGGEDAEWAGRIAATIRAKSPTSLKIAFEQMRRGATLPFTECMRLEFRIVSRLIYGHDFYEGVRATIIDKDNRPSWRPASLDAVDPAEVERHFAPLDRELDLL